MTERQTTVMVLLPGRNAFSIVVPRSPRASVALAVLLPLLTGVVSQRALTADSQSFRSAAHVAMGSVGNVSPAITVSNALRDRLTHRHGSSAADGVMTSVQGALAPRGVAPENPASLVVRGCVTPGPGEPALVLDLAIAAGLPTEPAAHEAAPAQPEPSPAAAAVPADDVAPAPEAAPDATATASTEPGATRPAGAVIDVKTMLRTLSNLRRGTATPDDVAHISSAGLLRLQALHFTESIAVHPFNERHEPNADDMAQISHAMRCRVTGTEIEIDPKLVEILVRLHALYGREIQLISGHRQPNTISTKSTSQHTLGRAADIRIPGVSIEELKRVALSLGARGVGLYPEKGFVHVDVRQQARYTWLYTAARGEQSDVRLASEAARKTAEPNAANAASSAESDSEAEPEAHEAESDLEQ